MTFRKPGRKIRRRDLIKGVVSAGAVAALSGCVSGPGRRRTAARGRLNPIERENRQPGTRDWLLTNTRIEPSTKYRSPWVEGYCSHCSASVGDTISFHASTKPAGRLFIDIFRMGYYDGAGGRLMARLGPLEGKTHPDPAIGPQRLRECQWPPCARLTIPRDWVSGVYLGKLTADPEGLQSYFIFVLRDRREADLLLQCSDFTWQAYNRWPDHFSLYDDGKDQWYWGPGVKISFDRPYGKYCQILDAPLSTGSGEWFLWEFPFAYWLESHGYDATYISNLDTHRDPKGLRRAKGFLSIGHDEYYSMAMFDHLRAAIGQGLNVAFFSGNTCCGRIDLELPRPARAAPVFSRADFFGPRDEAEIKRFPAMAKLPHESPNANLLIGARSVSPITGGADWSCALPDHWIFAGTGMKRGEGIPGLVGWEWHGDPANLPGLEVVATGKTWNGNTAGTYTATLYPGPRGNFVFNASTCWWGDGLSEPPGYVRPSAYTHPQGPDRRVQQITANILNRICGSRRALA